MKFDAPAAAAGALTFFTPFFYNVDSSPKSTIHRNLLLLPKEPLIASLDFQTTPTRRRKERPANVSGDDSPTMSQEMTVTWRWNNENSPVRSPAASRVRSRKDRMKDSPNNNLYRASIRSNAPSSTTSNSASSSEPNSYENDSRSPKGLYKFQEEMKKIQLNSHTLLQVSPMPSPVRIGNRSYTRSRPSETPRNPNKYANAAADQSPARAERASTDLHIEEVKPSTTAINFDLNNSLKEDLLNDSDFDQVLSTCTETVEKTFSQEANSKQTDKKPQPKSAAKPISKLNNSSYMNFFNDESIDDILGDIDDSIISSGVNLNNSKLMRHNSMPQQTKPSHRQTEVKQPQKTAQSTAEKRNFSRINQSTSVNRKSFTRHESMPVSATKRKSSNDFNHSKYTLTLFLCSCRSYLHHGRNRREAATGHRKVEDPKC